VTSETIREQLAVITARILDGRVTDEYSRDEGPLRSELFSTDQMVQHGKALAGSHQLSPERTPDQLLKRLAENEDVLLAVRNLTAEAVKSNRRITPAAEWLLDNFYLIEEQIRTARRHLPKGYSRELPRLASGPSAGLPRVYDLALETISHGDGRVDPESLSSFIAAYQAVAVLKLGELWALPIMLRLALIENLRRVASRIAADRLDRNRADQWADSMTETAEKDPKSLILVIADMARSNPPMVSSFVAELARRLQGQGPALALPLTWIEQRLSESGTTIQLLVQEESQQQAADQVSLSNSIGSLRALGAMDWREFVERMSAVEQILRGDLGGIYGDMDFATRDRYRHAVEKVARRSRLSESEVAQAAIKLAGESVAGNGGSPRAAHVGYYLIDKGLPRLEQMVGARRWITLRFPLAIYLGGILLISAGLTAGLLVQGLAGGLRGWDLAALGALSLLSMSQLAVAIVNWLATLLVKPHPLPRMDYSEGLPAHCRTLVVVPSLLLSSQNVDELVEELEVRFLANQDQQLYFGLLTDFRDADQETLPEDDALLSLARQKIEDLNVKYPRTKSSAFFLFHRPRRWEARDRIWMGYERKRGKLGDLNAFLRGEPRSAAGDRFSLVIGDTSVLDGVKYVITLDTDTQLARETAREFTGAMAHPLNQPWYDERKERITEGYSILQPRVAVSLPGTSRSRYARLWGSEPGIDPYTRAVSDVYQDLFGEGSFIGKGIYDVDAFERALRDRFPENRILSHDLLEGCYARAGLLSDAQLYEEYPSLYSADVSRRHRWIRGDWQIARWLLPFVPGPAGRAKKNPLSGLSRWKIFDNLRRSLVPPALTLLLVLAWIVLPAPWIWTWAVFGIILVPALMASIVDVLRKPDDVLLGQHLASVWRYTERSFAQASFTLVCLPHEAVFNLDAIARTMARMLLTHKRLLEWNPSGNAGRRGAGFFAAWRSMGMAPLLACAAAGAIAWHRPSSFEMAAPVLALWFASPAIAWWISRPVPRREPKLSGDQVVFLRKMSRKTWAFFETFAGPEDHWLPPDNFQEQPAAIVAHRTSPTNMGLALLANLSACDFGYISAGRLIERTSHALDTMEGLERHRGHFFNWYDTQTLKPLPPNYISSVDSGNLSGHLLTLRPGLLELSDREIVGRRTFEGLRDTLAIVMDAAEGTAAAELAALERDLNQPCPAAIAPMRTLLEKLSAAASQLTQALDAGSRMEASGWAHAFVRQCRDSLEELTFLLPDETPEGIPTLRQLAGVEHDTETRRRAQERIAGIERLAGRASELAHVEYDFLFDKSRHLLAIGYNVGERRCDPSYYDLLASEARLATFVAIAQDQMPQESWFALGRLLTTASAGPVLLSWSGSMFEYLMPLLVMPTFNNTLLDQTYRAAVETQIEYGRKRGVPWGFSESGYNAVDVHLNYQYRAFGVPALGLKRGLGEDLVVAPYASALALMVAPEKACANLQRLAANGLEGKFGLYEAVDYTSSRLPRGQTSATVRSFMAHHQGMSLLSLAYLLLDRPMQRRFESDPLFQATMLLLQERIPKARAVYSHTSDGWNTHPSFSPAERPIRVLNAPDPPVPEVQLLSNGRYHVMLTSAGGGYSRWKEMAVTRWREDVTRDNWGAFCYLRDVKSGEFWSTSYQPTLKRTESSEAIFSEARAEFRCRNMGFDTHTEIAVSPEDDIEVRRVSITNRNARRREIEVTSYAEVVLASPAGDALHPAFSNLFVQTEIIREQRAILCTRRPRSQDERVPWMFHLMAIHGAELGEVSYETDRMRFLGRGNTAADPDAMHGAAALSGSQGSVLDPIVAIRYRIVLEPEEMATINIVSGVGDSRAACMGLVEKYQDRRLADRVFDLAWTHSQVVLSQLNATDADALLYERLASSVIYANPSLRADSAVLILNRRGQSGLWGYAISGDWPIVLVQISDGANIELVRQLVQAHAYWRLKGLMVDLVIWNEDRAGYRQVLQDQIIALISAGVEADIRDRPGGIFVRPGDQISSEDRILLQSVARAILSDSRGTLLEQINQRRKEISVPRFAPKRVYQKELRPGPGEQRRDLLFFNGLGGFTPDGREYIVTTSPGVVTPAPWVNVLANSQFGTVVSESGSAATWSENAHEFRLTPWTNDPVTDSSGEAFYIRDEESGQFWSPMPLPCRGLTPYATRHGFGYSVFEHTESGIRTEVMVYVALDSPVKFTVVKAANESGQARKLSVTGFAEWVLGDLRSKTAMHVITERDPNSGALFARNPYNTEFPDRVGFFSVDDAGHTVSCDRTEFLGRNGSPRSPAAMGRARLSGKTGGGLDPCAAIQVPFELAAGAERTIVFTLGAAQNADEAAHLVNRFRGSAAAAAALDAVWQYWKHTLGAVNVETPDRSLNILANGWLLYQTLACRIWARNGYYQPGGAYGFRDQLQDTLALVHAEPGLLREHLLRCASRQFREGDVQHWWHPPQGRGVRTHCSDDFLWLPLAVARYVTSTGDTGVLDELVPYLEGRPVNADEDSYYDLPVRSSEVASLYGHCVAAILRGLRFGQHGMPLMGTGDWNDGMNLVGAGGKGESVWLGFFLYQVLTRFAAVARPHGDVAFADRCEQEAVQLAKNIEQSAWDGEWYRRAYFDDGTPLGSAENDDCRIDSIAQSWSVLSGAGGPERSRAAMEAVDQRLVRRKDALIQLLDPPFDHSTMNPGYIKGYVPGVRENGGQYTHAAIWAIMAFAALGHSRRAWELFGLINPVNHASSAQAIQLYKVEPYVVAADVYAVTPHTGRGGWTWYTGSAGWMYRLIVESLLGLRLETDKLYIAPCFPGEWTTFTVHYRYRETVYHITVNRALTGVVEAVVPLVDDRQDHTVKIALAPNPRKDSQQATESHQS
jgi:cyclic beta-1,2-glucan synthetase